jgi:hypothetical protein
VAKQLCFWIAVSVWAAGFGSAQAQVLEPPARETDTGSTPAPVDQPAPDAPAPETLPMPKSIGGMPDPPRGQYEYYTSPLKTIGTGMFAGGYVVSAGVSLVYLVFVYPLQALFGSSKVETVMPWLLLPIVGPWLAQYEDHVKHSPAWRAVLIGDAAIQATGLVVGLIGAALSGRRPRAPDRASRLELHVGVAGVGVTGLTLTVHAL